LARKTVDVVVSHTLPQADAKARIEALGDYYSNRYAAKVTWDGDHARVVAKWSVVKLDVAVDVTSSEVRLKAPDPGRMLRSRMVGYAERKLRSYLDPNRELESLARN